MNLTVYYSSNDTIPLRGRRLHTFEGDPTIGIVFAPFGRHSAPSLAEASWWYTSNAFSALFQRCRIRNSGSGTTNSAIKEVMNSPLILLTVVVLLAAVRVR